eukprot:c26511_g1_i1.p1 GENE.c26511_g1_i1~~c26511_g1_i1.p1  ORF type:complete len:284 (-),score=46.02 c26511_g1_i1:155-1006(-)
MWWSSGLVLVCSFLAVHAELDPCIIDNDRGVPTCDSLLFHGHCVRPYVLSKPKWCHWVERDIDVCCANRDAECCKASSAAGQFALTIVLIVLVACCCCCIALSRSLVTRPHATRRTGVWYRVTTRIPAVRRHYERQQTMETTPNSLSREQTIREPVPKFDFPKLKPLDIEPKECIVCFHADRNTVLPCGHSLLCEDCTKLILAKGHPCPNCRTYFSNYVVAEKQPTFRDFSQLDDEDENENDNGSPPSSISLSASNESVHETSEEPESHRTQPENNRAPDTAV